MESAKLSKTEQHDEDENRTDFELLRQQLNQALGEPRNTGQENLWPLRLKTIAVDHYILGDIIGTGSYAEVRECIDTLNLRRCAVKIVDKNHLRRQAPKALANQLQEIRLLRRLRHPNIIALIECRLKGPKVYIFLEHCTFVLHDLLQEQADGRFHCSQMVRNLFGQLATGLAYLHSVGIVHRDVKPQNVLITNCGTVKLIDFGVSLALSVWHLTGFCRHSEGSPLFQAPELIDSSAISGEASAAPVASNFKVDVWAAGVTLYLMLFGEYPFQDDNLLGLYDKILSDELDFPKHVEIPSKRVACDLLASMLDKSSANRATIEEALGHPWLSLNHSANHREASLVDQRHSEFLELTQRRRFLSKTTSSSMKNTGTAANSRWKDIYESMSVIPYLHNYHFPQSQVLRAASASSSNSGSGSRDNKSTPSSTTTTTTIRDDSALVSATTDPHEIITHADEHAVEWGTAEQYSLLKVPQVRANRLDPASRPSSPWNL